MRITTCWICQVILSTQNTFHTTHERISTPFAGDDKYDISFGTGVCTDVHYDYMHSGCDSQVGAQVTMGLTSCWPKGYIKGNFLCGVLVDIDEDYVHSVGIDVRSIIYPRVLIEESQINGITQQRVTCWTQFDCQDKCDTYARKAHSGGLPSPPACALCAPPCPNNVAETIVTAIRALGIDIMTALRLAALCLNPVACVCQARHAQTQTISLLGDKPNPTIAQVFMMLRPAWIDNLPNELQECSAPDILMMILDKVAVALLTLIENMVNVAFIDPINKILRPVKEVKIGFNIKIPVINKRIGFEVKPFDFIKLMKRLCIPYKDIKDCRSDAELAELAALLGCSWDDKELWKRCYYERVRRARLLPPIDFPSHPHLACSGQIHLPRGRRDGQRLQGPLSSGLAGRAHGGVREHSGRLLRRCRPVDAAAV